MPTPYADYAQRHLYTRHSLGNGYSLSKGEFIIPIAEDEPTDPEQRKNWQPFARVRVHADILFRTVEFDTTKSGGPPQTPYPGDTGKFLLVDAYTFIHGPRINANGWTSTWQVEGAMTFAVAAPVTAELNNGYQLGSLPFPTDTQQSLTQTFGSGAAPTEGSLQVAGGDAKACYSEAQGVSFSAPYYVYRGTSLYPGQFFNTGMLIGDTVSPGVA